MATSPEPAHPNPPPVTRFGGFELDLQSGVLFRNGTKNRLQGQPLQLLELLLQQPGQLVTREQVRQHLWPDGTVVEFEHSVNAAVKRLRAALDDDADNPAFIETIPRRGYRFIARVENGAVPAPAAVEEHLAPVRPLGPTPALWNKRPFVLIAGAAVFLLMVASWRVFSARPGLTQTDVILLASFVNKTGDPIFDSSLDKALEVKLTESPFLSLFPEADVRRMMGMMRHEPNERVTQELGIEICKRQGLKAVVVPEIAAFGSKYLITLEAIDAQNQKSIARRQEEVDSKDKVIAALGRAASGLRTQLGERLSSLEKYDAPLDLATTSSLEALQAYREGQMQFRSGKTREAIPFFERAVELDPQFCSAYGMLGHAYFSIGDGETAKKNFAKAFALKDGRVTQEENFQITDYYHSYITGNLEKEMAVLVLYQQAYPRSVLGNRLGIVYARLGKKEEALEKFKWTIEHSPQPAAHHYSNAAQALLVLDRLDEAKKLLDEWTQKGSLAPFQREMRYRIAWFDHDTATMERLAREIPADDVRWLELQLQFAFLRGDLGKFRSLSQTLVDQDRRANRKENTADDLALHGQLEAFLGNSGLASKLCHEASRMDQDSPSELWRCSEAFAYAGEVAQAEVLTAKLDRMFPEDTVQQKVYLPVMRSNIERARGNAVKAADLLAPALQYRGTLDVNYQLAQAYLAAGEPAKAAAELEELLGHRGSGWWHIYVPLAQLGLGRAYAMQGEREKSRKAYDDFFTTWKDADPDIPILRQAKAEYKKLTATPSAAALASAIKQ
ncbi:MAG: winged helix-turn-helix domain-containing protein [Acidobacteriia bacterium]|nr:winged helix-turn-helix domain-containing protein [Terriglobia bacterium]